MTMGHLLAYSLTCAIILTLLYAAYRLSLSGTNRPACNRAVLLGIYLTSTLYIPAAYLIAATFHSFTNIPATIEISGLQAVGTDAQATEGISSAVFSAILWLYLTGMLVAAIRTAAGAMRIWRIVSGSQVVKSGSYTVLVNPEASFAPFSWRKYVVMSERDWEETGAMIEAHEYQHLLMRHWMDLVIAELTCVLQWYNPAAWKMQEELKAVHEYQADRAVIDSGADRLQYQMLLVAKATGRRNPIVDSLNSSILKNRITMMQKSNTPTLRLLRGLALIPALAVAIAVTNIEAVASVLDSASTATLAQSPVTNEAPEVVTEDIKSAPTDGKKVYYTPEVAPEYPGGLAALMNFLAQHIQYPPEAYKNDIEGRVVVRFVVDKDGSVRDAEVIRSVSPELDAEAIRVVNLLSGFTPGKVLGEPVAVNFALPINFKLPVDTKR